MAGRSITVANQIELTHNRLRPIHLLEMQLDSGTVFVTDAYREIVWNTNTYQALGHFLQFDGIEETAAMQVNDTVITLSGVDQTMYALFLTEHYVNRIAVVYLGLIDSTDALIVDPFKMLQGRMDAPFIDEDPDAGSATLGVRVINQWSDYERINGRRTNHNSQASIFSTDKGMLHAHKVEEPITWGRRT